jgi:FkbM family methyltransferase
MKQTIRHIIRKFGYDIVRFNPGQIGKDPRDDMARFLHNDRPIIFDVGANVGQSIDSFRFKFPRCIVHSFEPSPTTFETLNQQASKFKDVHLWNCALGSVCGQMTFLENLHSDMSSFLPLGEFGWGKVMKETLVEVKTIDRFCDEESIEQIDILKSDTQGFELEVFRGAERTIRANRIGLIYFEIIFSDMYENLPSFAQIYDFLRSRDFLLVSFYQFYYQKQLASWTDALFIQKSYIG